MTLYDKVHTSDKMYDVMSPDDVRRAASDNMINVNYNLLQILDMIQYYITLHVL